MKSLLALLLLAITAGTAAFAAGASDMPYPQGKRFPLGLYSIETLKEMQAETKYGWNIAQTYNMKPDYLSLVKQAGWFAMAHLGQVDQQQTQEVIKEYEVHGPVAWWDFPEEQRYWRKNEYNTVKNLSAWTRQYDPQHHPRFMYIPGHYTADAIARYVPYLDIIGAGAYTEYAHRPRSYVRWVVSNEIAGIKQAGYQIGPDYLHGEKTPIGIVMLFARLQDMGVISPVEGYHDFYSALASGARGLLVFSYWHKRDVGVLQQTYEAYAKAASEVSGPAGLGQALLFGTPLPLRFKITRGPQHTYSFRPVGVNKDVIYPSLNVLAREYQGNLYVIAVNSAEGALQATISGLPAGMTEINLPFEKAVDRVGKPTGQMRSVGVKNGELQDSFGWLGVHIYKEKLP